MDQQPAGMGAALRGDPAVVTSVARLVSTGDQSDIGSGVVGSGKTCNVSYGGVDAFGDGKGDAGDRHE